MDESIVWTLSEWPVNLPEEDQLVFLGPAERVRWESFRFEKRRREWLLGRVTAKKLVHGLYPAVEYPAIEIHNEPEGAPFVIAQGERLPGCLSVSHRDQLAAAAWTPAGTPIGIDLETVEPRSNGFVEDYFTGAEQAAVAALDGVDQITWVNVVWSAKEAVLKVLRKGLRLDTRAVEILPASEEPFPPEGWQPLTVRCALLPEVRAYWTQRGGYVLTLAAGGRRDELDLMQVNIDA